MDVVHILLFFKGRYIFDVRITELEKATIKFGILCQMRQNRFFQRSKLVMNLNGACQNADWLVPNSFYSLTALKSYLKYGTCRLTSVADPEGEK